MQVDMHYYGTYALALAAGFPQQDAEIIAYASQYVDDSTSADDVSSDDGGLFVTYSTAHHLIQSIISMGEAVRHSVMDQRKIWVPNHFIPGGVGCTLEERVICIKNSAIAQTMFKDHLETAQIKAWGLELIGIATHAYMDTFSHYGFSGFSSPYNRIIQASIRVNSPTKWSGIGERLNKIMKGDLPGSYLTNNVQSLFTEGGNTALGHGAVMSYPDIPYLDWEFDYELKRPNKGKHSVRKNHDSFMEACRAVYDKFVEYVRNRYDYPKVTPFEDIEGVVSYILRTDGASEERCKAWSDSGLLPNINAYDAKVWERQKKDFADFGSSERSIASNCYRFHQAATYHRYYMIKDLLPSVGIAVF